MIKKKTKNKNKKQKNKTKTNKKNKYLLPPKKKKIGLDVLFHNLKYHIEIA